MPFLNGMANIPNITLSGVDGSLINQKPVVLDIAKDILRVEFKKGILSHTLIIVTKEEKNIKYIQKDMRARDGAGQDHENCDVNHDFRLCFNAYR